MWPLVEHAARIMTREERFVCPAHFEDSYLIQLVRDDIDELGEDAEPCSFCDHGELGARIELLADALRDTIGRYYATANDAGVPWDEGEYVFPVLDTSDVVADLDAIADWRVHESIVDLLEDEAWVRTHDPAPPGHSCCGEDGIGSASTSSTRAAFS